MIKLEIECNNGRLKVRGSGEVSDAEIILTTPLIVKEIVKCQASQIAMLNKDANIYAMAGTCVEELQNLQMELLYETNARK